MKILLAVLVATTLLASGCSSTKITHSRGWIGGRYEEFRSNSILAEVHKKAPLTNQQPRRNTAIVIAVYPKTPAQLAGIEAGDLILKVGLQTIEYAGQLQEYIDTLEPGSTHPIQIFRENKLLERSLTIGREQYQWEGTLSLGLALSTQIDILPNPSFNLFSLLQFQSSSRRIELHSPRGRWQANPEKHRRTEGWRFFIAFFGMGKHKKILSQTHLTTK